ncbi:MAG TPA: M23 family metallopeptidase [Usitatibacter sp.]|nr:M23 family metallopeptidase [Usitatibacter sp.]
MSLYDSDRPRRKAPVILVLLLLIIAGLLAAAYYLRPRFETQPPQVRFTPDSDVAGLAPIEIEVSDTGAGLKSLSASLSVGGGAEQPLASEQYAQPVRDKKITVALAKVPGIKEGPAVLRVTARDASLWNFFKGNETVVQKNVTIDVTPPSLELIADDRYVNFGGVGALVYKASADTVKSGVKLGDAFFPGFAGLVKDHPDYFFVLFAHPYNAAPEARPLLVATDKAGNSREMRVVYELKNVKYKKSTIALSDSFLQNKVVPLADVAARQASPRDVFIDVNEKVRKANEDRITEITGKASPQILWKGAFSQLSNSKVEANFADLRTYTYNGQAISTKYHLGYDLSVTKHYPIEAANSGKVAFAGDLGIYGNAVVLDHGLGLFTLYGHMSSIDVKVGDMVQKKQVLGKTGETGLAAGDHLHYGVYLDGIAILPVEWWDQKWIDDNIEPKLEGRSGEEIAQAQQPASRRPAHKRRR